MKTRLAEASLCAALLVLGACSKNQITAPASPGGDGAGNIAARGSGKDAAAAHGDDSGTSPGEAGALSDAGVLVTDIALPCRRVDPVAAANEDMTVDTRPSGATAPADFVITRESATWTNGCSDPQLLIELAGGTCSASNGHKLQIWISKSAFDDASLVIGENILLPEPDNRGVRVRYTRPRSLSSDPTTTGTWGTCSGATGQLVFPDVPDLTLNSTQQVTARFLLTLTRCSGETGTPIDVNGAFNIAVRNSLASYCPGK